MSDFSDSTVVHISLGAWSHFCSYVSEMKKLAYLFFTQRYLILCV